MILAYILIAILVLNNIKIYGVNRYNLEPLIIDNGNSIKGLAALIIVLHHISQRMTEPGILKLFLFIGYLAVSLFFFCSGYGLMRSLELKNNYLDGFIKNRLPRIIIPFIISNIIFLLIYILVGVKISFFNIISYVIGIKLIDDFKWYIQVIIIFYSIFYVCFKYLSKKKAIITVFLFTIIYSLICFSIGKGIWWYNSSYCFVIGIILGGFDDRIFKVIKSKYILSTIVIAIIFTVTFGVGIIKENIIVNILSSILFVLMCVCVLMKVKLQNRYLRFLGSISFEIYLVHGIIVKELQYTINNKYIYLIICVTISIFMAYIFSLINRNILRIIYKK